MPADDFFVQDQAEEGLDIGVDGSQGPNAEALQQHEQATQPEGGHASMEVLEQPLLEEESAMEVEEECMDGLDPEASHVRIL
eukprot:1148079-Pelagomonas_calceolata.AAC.2